MVFGSKRTGSNVSEPPPPPPSSPPPDDNGNDEAVAVPYGADDQSVEAQHVVYSFSEDEKKKTGSG